MTDALVESMGLDTSEMQVELSNAIKELHKNTHVREGTLLEDQDAIDAFAQNSYAAVITFLDTIDELRALLGGSAVHTIGTGVFEKFIETSVGDLDILSTHTQVESVQIEDTKVVSIGLNAIQYAVAGTVYVTLVYGSGSDFDRGDGASLSEAFPFTCSVEGSVAQLDQLVEVSDLEVDTASWFE